MELLLNCTHFNLLFKGDKNKKFFLTIPDILNCVFEPVFWHLRNLFSVWNYTKNHINLLGFRQPPSIGILSQLWKSLIPGLVGALFQFLHQKGNSTNSLPLPSNSTRKDKGTQGHRQALSKSSSRSIAVSVS
uniref:Uncharacterized protein n=1 Tax=Cucumis sativus TaxID=3659 RepID=A0A0A0KNL9_CUCSA